MSRFFNTKQIVNSVVNSQFPQAQQAMNNPIQFIVAELQKGNPQMMQKVMQIWTNPSEVLNKYYANNPEMQSQVNKQMQGLNIQQQREVLIKEVEASGINVRELASNFGIRL